MPRPPRKPKLAKAQSSEQVDDTAAESSLATDQTQDGKNPAAVALGRLGGKKGGKARAEKLTAEQRREIAKKAAEARWKKNRS